MNRTIIEGTLRELKAALSGKIAALTHNERLRERAEEERVVGQLQRGYGRLKEDAERLLRRWSEHPEQHAHSWRGWQSRDFS